MGGQASERELARGDDKNPARDIEHGQKLETLGMLACGVAHDFNNLLVAILGNAGLALQDLEECSNARPQVEEIKRAAVRAAELTEQVLIYAGRGKEPAQVMELNLAIREMTELLRVSIPQTTVLELDLCAEDLPLEAVPGQIRQVLMNLILNAAQSLPDQRGEIRIATASQGGQASLEVSDTGSGVSASTQSKIFDPFFTTRSKGSGLGLAAVKRIIERHGGKISVRSQLGEGTRFSIRLACSSRPYLAADAQDEVQTEYRGHGQVLIVDPDDSARQLLSTCLTRLGFDVEEISDPGRVSRTCRQLNGDLRLAILDLGKNTKAGEEALRAIRKINPDLPVMISSGLGRGEAQGIEGQIFNAFLSKPYSPEQLLEAVKTALEDD
ncbi:MAG: sensor histidine kinase [Planctomycetota bacterium]|jgi:CheY-like chemotaxis protein